MIHKCYQTLDLRQKLVSGSKTGWAVGSIFDTFPQIIEINHKKKNGANLDP